MTVSVGLAVHTQGLCGGLAVGLCIQLVLGLGRGLPGEGPLATLDVLSAEDACVCTQVQLGASHTLAPAWEPLSRRLGACAHLPSTPGLRCHA